MVNTLGDYSTGPNKTKIKNTITALRCAWNSKSIFSRTKLDIKKLYFIFSSHFGLWNPQPPPPPPPGVLTTRSETPCIISISATFTHFSFSSSLANNTRFYVPGIKTRPTRRFFILDKGNRRIVGAFIKFQLHPIVTSNGDIETEEQIGRIWPVNRTRSRR